MRPTGIIASRSQHVTAPKILGTPSLYIQGPGTIDDLGKVCSRYGKMALVICHETVWNLLGEQIKVSLLSAGIAWQSQAMEGECCHSEIERLLQQLILSGCDHIIGLGGRKVIDTAFCIRCGHCVAVCPEGALSLPFLSPEECPNHNPELSITAEQAIQWVKSRRSIRAYRTKPIDPHAIDVLFDTIRYAPTAKNIQPVKWLLMSDRNTIDQRVELVIRWMEEIKDAGTASYPIRLLDKIITAWREDGTDRICRGAPHLTIAYGQADLPAAQNGCMIALTTLELLAPAFGLGAC